MGRLERRAVVAAASSLVEKKLARPAIVQNGASRGAGAGWDGIGQSAAEEAERTASDGGGVAVPAAAAEAVSVADPAVAAEDEGVADAEEEEDEEEEAPCVRSRGCSVAGAAGASVVWRRARAVWASMRDQGGDPNHVSS